MAFQETFREVALTIVRFSGFAANALIFGVIPFVVLILRPIFRDLSGDEWARGRGRIADRIERIVGSALVASALAAFLAILLQALLVSEFTGGEVETSSLASVLETSFGQWYVVRFPLLAALALVLGGRIRQWTLRGSRLSVPMLLWWVTWGVLSLALLATSSFSGHAAVAVPRVISLVNDIVHLAAGATWFAGIVLLAVVLPDAWIDVSEQERLQVLAPAVARFSILAGIAITIVALTGIVNSLLHVGSLNDLVDSSYGRTLALKIVVFLGILGLGGVNHYFVRARLTRARGDEPKGAARLFRKTIAAELAAGLVVMALTGLLVGLARTRQTPAGGAETVVSRQDR